MASPNGSPAETTTEERDTSLAEVEAGQSYDERAEAAFRALQAGHDPREINDAYTKPFPKADETADANPEEAKRDEEHGTTDDSSSKSKGASDDTTDDDDEYADVPDDRLEQYLVAKRVLSRDNLTEADIRKLGIDRAIELAEDRAKQHREVDRRFSQPKDEPKDEPVKDETEDATPEDELIASIAEIDEDLAKQVSERLKSSETSTSAARKALAQERFQGVVNKASERYPELKDDATFNRVLDRAKALAKSPGYRDGVEGATDAFNDACVLVLSPGREQRAQDRLLEDNRNHRDGQLDTDTTVDVEKQPMNQDQRDSYAMKLLGQGKSPKEVQAIIRKIPRP